MDNSESYEEALQLYKQAKPSPPPAFSVSPPRLPRSSLDTRAWSVRTATVPAA